MIKSIAIVGCGWLGLSVAKKFLLHGWQVFGTTTSPEKVSGLTEAGIKPAILRFPADEVPSGLFDVDTMLISIPPRRRDPESVRNYPKVIAQIIHCIQVANPNVVVLFTSSTSVYSQHEEYITESTPPKPETDSGRAILESESIISASGLRYLILRCGGMVGPGRHPGRFFAGKTNVEGGNQSVNMIHLDDLTEIIYLLASGGFTNTIFNLVAPAHPSKKDFYTQMAQDIGLSPPFFKENEISARRIVDGTKLLQDTNYSFHYPDPMNFKF